MHYFYHSKTFHPLSKTNHALLLDAILQALIIYLSFSCFTLLKSIMLSHRSNMNNSSSLFIKVIIIKVYSKKAHIIAENVKISDSRSSRSILSLNKTTSSRFSSFLFITKQSGTNSNDGRGTSKVLSQISWFLYQSRHYFRIKILRKEIYHKFLESYINHKQNQIQKGKYQQLYHTFFLVF